MPADRNTRGAQMAVQLRTVEILKRTIAEELAATQTVIIGAGSSGITSQNTALQTVIQDAIDAQTAALEAWMQGKLDTLRQQVSDDLDAALATQTAAIVAALGSP